LPAPEVPFNTDGLVIKINNRALYDRLGMVGKNPRGAVAYKYAAEQATTIVRDIVEAGLYAPRSMGSESVRTIVITDKVMREKLIELNCQIGHWKKGFDPFYGAPVILLVIADKDDANHLCNGCIAIATMMLAAESLDLHTCWIHRAKEELEQPLGHELLSRAGILFRPGQYVGIGHLALGYAAGDVPEAKPRNESRISYIS